MYINKNFFFWLTGLTAGFINGLLGTGGGMMIVPSLISSGLNRQKAHANSVCIIFCICMVSALVYFKSGKLNFSYSLPYIPWGIAGSILGSILLPKINQNVLRKLFGCFSIWAAYRLISR